MISVFVSCILFLVTSQPFLAARGAATAGRITLFPKLHAGQTFTYLLESRTKKNIKIESRVFTPSGPDDAQIDTQWLLHVEILEVRPQGDRAAIQARSRFQSVNTASEPTRSDKDSDGSDAKSVEFTLLPDGRVEGLTGMDDLFLEQRQAWQDWLRQFAIAAVFPREGVKPGQTWKSTEQEQAPSPIIKLEWDKRATYVRDEPCTPIQMADTSAAPNDPPPETCAVILTRAVLKQKSRVGDTTPKDFSMHALSTSGTATGTNETISYISLKTGLVMRVTEDAQQFMDVIIAKTDGSNQVHYNINAASHTEVFLIAPSSRSNP
jgi:hypothetical protein